MEVISPPQLFQVKGQVYPVQSVVYNNVPAVSVFLVSVPPGYRCRVMGLVAQTNYAAGAVGQFALKSNPGGGYMFGLFSAPLGSAGDTLQLPITPSGYFETLTGEGLYMDVITSAINITVFYILYIP